MKCKVVKSNQIFCDILEQNAMPRVMRYIARRHRVATREFWKRFGCSPNGHVEDVTADGTRHGHVAVSLSRHDDARDKVRYAGASCEERQAHHFRRYGHCVTGDIRPPDHQVRVRRDPEDRADERYREELLP